ncbi:hypothetical protein FJT64_016258 [Amphibalanus amphitrite]|uniref:Farnesoic acid O-methyl transferase domain-containing protein n=1 Tax=Amphibalanus amphitrite TaxID=1232801 RepID=A0A6A4XFA7_AMPAM|nr:hypothetical protein FJT64_016258 [Amphibalanus amphitrite]
MSGVEVMLALLLLVLLLWEPSQHGAEAKYASGARRSGHRLKTDTSPPLEQHQAGSAVRCLNLCDGAVNCFAINFGTMSGHCQLLSQRACHGLPLVADAAFDYYDVYDEPQNLTAETKTPFWDDSSCLWRMDWHKWTWKKLKPGTCTLDINIKLGVGAEALISSTWLDSHGGNRIVFRFSTFDTDLFYHNATGTIDWLAMNVRTPGLVNTNVFSRLRISWCEGNMAVGPVDNPTLVTAKAFVTQPIDFVMVHSYNAPSWVYVDSGVADPWLFEDSGVAEDAVMDIGTDTYVYRNITATSNVTITYDCMTKKNCDVALQQDSPTIRMLRICVGCGRTTYSALLYYGDVEDMTPRIETGPVLSSTEFNTFRVSYDNGFVTIHHNGGATPIYSANAPHLMTNINIIGIGGCCARKSVRVARYDPAWRTDTWMTEGRGFSNSGILL